MELGYALPTAGALASTANIVRVAQEAERLGYAALWTYERLLRPVGPVDQLGGGEPQELPEDYRLVFEPLETLSYVAALTSRIGLGTSVVGALLHPPVVLARRFATLDQFSGGRVLAGLGQGWMKAEFDTANVPMRRMGAGFDELVAAMRAAWGPDPVSYDGRFYQITPSEINPKPVQASIPIYVGAMTPKGVARAAGFADGLNPVVFSRDQLLGAATLFREAVKDAGRDPESVRVVARANVPLTTKPFDGERPFLGGSPDQIADDLATLQGKGVDHVFFANMAPGDLDQELDLMAQIKAAAG
jgi:probable F420-dependent oxidoreductase